MVSLVDIVPQTRTVQIAGGELELRGLGIRQIADLLLRFPEFRKYLVAGGGPAVDADAVLVQFPGWVGAVIAEAAGQPEAEDAIADKMRPEDVMECLVAIHDLSIPEKHGPLFRLLLGLLGGVPESGSPGEVVDMNMPRRQSA